MSLVRGAQSILCPRSMRPNMAPEHELHDRLTDAAHDAAEWVGNPNEHEMVPASEKMYSAVVAGRGDNAYGMRAYVAEARGVADGVGLVTVRAAWLQCQVCGLIISGTYQKAHEELRGR